MSRIQSTFAALGGEKALISYITAGDPDKETTLGLMHSLAANGADIIELGVPFSDPMADGPTIQRAAERALAKGVSLNDVLDIVRAFRQTDRTTPVILMGYFNPVHKMGYARFAEAAAEAGVDGVLTVDAPVENIGGLHGELKSHGIDCIFLIAPTTTEERIRSIAAVAGGFVYCPSAWVSASIMLRAHAKSARWPMPLLLAAASSKKSKITRAARQKQSARWSRN